MTFEPTPAILNGKRAAHLVGAVASLCKFIA
nr:MAG TPA: hypothetical protein [Caudoviricetes sp.]DAJ59128.1 MAG TPA: hypothetical protein [Caudoviricetes sp.]